MSRGFSAIALDSPKSHPNIGGAIRACGNYGASLLVLGRERCRVKFCTDTMKQYRHMPVIRCDDVFDAIPFDCTPVAIELLPAAIPLPKYTHPERAFYIFGAEDATLGARITDRCRNVVYVPTHRCMNLAATVNVVLYDRATKRNEWPIANLKAAEASQRRAAE